MEVLVNDLFEIIKDHREDEGFMSLERIRSWAMQFDEVDREFVLAETIHIFKQRYVSKEDGRKFVKILIEHLINLYKYSTVKEFIKDSYFINNQGQNKSQAKLIEFLDQILKEDYNTELAECNEKSPKYIVYLDDFLCTGKTIVDGLTDSEKGWFNQKHLDGHTNYDEYIKNDATLVCAYLVVHKYCEEKLANKLYYAMEDKKIINVQTIWAINIDNRVSNSDAHLQFIFPIETNSPTVLECKQQIENKIHKLGRNTSNIVYRQANLPVEEKLFSSPENRVRYELIILEKSIEYYNFIGNDKIRARPLGYGLVHDISFGFGTLIFSWRNVPFNAPLVFWYPYYGRQPLFERVFT